MKKRFLAMLLSAVTVFTLFSAVSFTASAEGELSGITGECTWTKVGDTLTISGNGKMKDKYSPWRSLTFTDLIIEEGVTYIGEMSFSHCKALCKVTLADSIIEIGADAFEYCDNITRVNVNSIEKWLTTVFESSDSNPIKHSNSFYVNDIMVTDLVIPNTVKEIPNYAFYDCNSLERITIPSSVIGIGEHAFYNCNKVENIVIPVNTEIIDAYAFMDCSSLKTVTIPYTVYEIGERAFFGCNNIEAVYYGNTEEEWKAIYNCDDNLKKQKIHYSNQVTSGKTGDCKWEIKGSELIISGKGKIGKAYWGSTITDITVKDGVTSIGAFNRCTSLKKVTIPLSVKNITWRTFVDIDGLNIYYNGTKEDWNGIDISFGNSAIEKAVIHFASPKENKCDGKHNNPSKIKTATVKAGFTKDGKTTKTCTDCKKVISTAVIKKVSSIKLSTTKYTYNGKVRTPSVTVKDAKGKTLKNGKDYTVFYAKGRKNVGKYTVKVTFKGNYSGSKSLSFTIVPKGTSVKSVTAGKKKLTVKWSKQTSQTTGYQIQYSTSKKFSGAKTVTVSKNKTTSKSISKLKGKKTYYVRVRTYKTVGKTKYYSDWNKAVSKTTKK